jgi:propionyl-CoA carboxylase beta chain
LLNNIIP